MGNKKLLPPQRKPRLRRKFNDPGRNESPKWRMNYTTGGWCRRRATCKGFDTRCGKCYMESEYGGKDDRT